MSFGRTRTQEAAMVLEAILFVVIGTCLACEFAVFFLVPGLLLAAAVVIWWGVAHEHLHAVTIALHVAALLFAVQAGYLLGAIALSGRKVSRSALVMGRGAAR